jgi:site-specific recombinase XerD
MQQFLEDSRIIEPLHQGPLTEHFGSYILLLKQQGYSRSSAQAQILLISRFSQWLERNGIETCTVDACTLQRFLRDYKRKRRVRSGDAAALARFLVLLRQKQAVPNPQPAPVSAQRRVTAKFQRYLVQERKLSQGTSAYCVRFAYRFLCERFKQGGVKLGCIRAADVTSFIQRHAHQHSPGYAKLLVTSLRSFFRHLHHRGVIATDLAACVPTVPSWSFSALPKLLPVGVVSRVLKNCDRQTPLGRRDYAILLLLARLGLRTCEVASLNLEDIDWDTGQIRVCGKGGESASLPLPADVGEALATHLRSGRPCCTSRRVFIRNRAPFTEFASPVAISCLARNALKKAGLDSTRRGAHLFRHTLATNLLRQGCSLDEIGELLRHRSPNTTAIYAKVDLDALRTLALPWPGGGQ